MKYFKQARQILIGLAAILLWTGLPAFQASAYVGVQLDNCRVLDKYDGNDGRRSITLRTALYYANKQAREDQRCRKSIMIEAEEINLESPLIVEILNVADDTDRYIYPLEGRRNGQAGETVKLSFAGLRGYDGPERHCAVIFRGGTHDIRLKNIVIENVPLDFNAVCIENSADYIILDGVRVAHVENGHGIVMEEGSNDNLIMGNSELVNIDGDGIHIKNTDILAHNFLSATGRHLKNEARPTGPNGTAVFGGGGGDDFVMKSIHGEFVHSDAPSRILLSEINTAGAEGVFRISGAVVNGSASCVPGIAPEAAGADFLGQLEQGVERIQVYAVAATEGESGPSNSAVFLTYVTKQEDCAETSCANGIGGASNPIGSAGNFGGIFHFVLDTNEFLDRINENRVDGAPVVTSIDKIVLVPEISGTVASATTPRRLIGGPSETDLCEGAQTGGGGEGGGNVDSGTGFINFALGGWSLRSQCQASAPTGGHPRTSVWDSDADGIPDYQEDLNHDCVCDADEFSCWDKPDSDLDGISDLAERKGTINEARWDEAGRRFLTDQPFCVTSLSEEDPCNADAGLEELTDDPILSDAQDDNSDNDACRLLDGQEDRARIFNDRSPAHYYIWGGIGNITPLNSATGDHLECTDFLETTGQDRIGAYYGVFVVKRDYSAVVRPYDYVRSPGSDEGIMPLVCLNDSVRRGTNFNGTWNESEGETKLDRAQTYSGTDDCECRGGQMQSKLGRNVCVYNCVDHEIFKGLPAEYVNNEATPSALKTGTDGVPVLYTEGADVIDALCSDIDQDDIPDCVENVTGQCNFTDRGHNLDPYLRDTDGDGLVDGPAVTEADEPDDCPFAICTDPRAIYNHRPVLAWFLDRDKDQLRDAEEDLNLDGRPDKLGGLEGRTSTETDPLNPDTDGDNIGDFVEVQSWNRYTNAADPDTDADGLPDGLEVLDYPLELTGLFIDDVATPNRLYEDQSGQGCGLFLLVDPIATVESLVERGRTRASRLGTDPAALDTDGDGIPDGIEVKCEDQTVNPPSGNLLTAGFTEIDICSNPWADDSDGDGWNDAREYAQSSAASDSPAIDGLMQYFESSPCDRDTDNDGEPDSSDRCPTSDNPQCTSVGEYGPDSDGDGLPDSIELILSGGNEGLDSDGDGQPNVNDPDSDNDGLLDGQEDIVPPLGEIQDELGDTDPLNPDTDNDFLSDGVERALHTDPNLPDSDGDCIPDGVELMADGDLSIRYIPGLHTDPANPDTDGDGLCDGRTNVTSGGLTGDVTCYNGEDNGGALGAIACDGVVNRDEQGRLLETDPRTADSDQDGIDDRTEICSGGQCNFAANIGHATRGAPGGCFSLNPAAPLAPSSMLYVYGLI
ncbi:MAG: hypothetical protein HY609_04395, partial [Deltaproteobacteria bacterium]|nr:hypothetical protein [Deltaproteobacteria bacterium]